MKSNNRVRRLESIVAKLKQARSIENRLLQLSELAYKVKDISAFYPALQKVVASVIHADNFYVALQNHENMELELAYFVDEKDASSLPKVKGLGTGITGYVFKTGKTLICDRLKYRQLVAEEAFVPLGTESELWFGVPLKQDDRVIGVMAIQSYQPTNEITEQTVAIFESLGLNLMTAIERILYRESLEREVKRQTKSLQKEIQQRKHAEQLQQSLYRISELSGSNVEAEQFYRELHKILGQLMLAENCYIALLEADESLSFPFYVDKYYPKSTSRQMSKGLTEFVISSQSPQLIDKKRADRLIEDGQVVRVNQGQHLANCWLGAPLVISGQVQGVIAVQSYDDDHQYHEDELQLLTFVSHHIAVAIERKAAAAQLVADNVLLEKKVEERTQELRQANMHLKMQVEQRKLVEQKLFHQANHDQLTDLPNRALFRSKLEQCLSHLKRHRDHQYAVLFIDLDNFKQINDQFGHQVGDDFLIEASKRIVNSVRGNDVVARFGGDEFVILLDQMDTSERIEDVAKRIIKQMAEPFMLSDRPANSGASIGICCFGRSNLSVDELLKQADDAMYQAKSKGRGCYVFSGIDEEHDFSS
mgnify:FL=1